MDGLLRIFQADFFKIVNDLSLMGGSRTITSFKNCDKNSGLVKRTRNWTRSGDPKNIFRHLRSFLTRI